MKNLAKRMVTVIGGVTIAAFVLMLAAPKAVHAIVSTLVTVSNSTANPVPTLSTDSPARQAVLLAASVVLFDGQATGTTLMTSGGTLFAVPAGQRLVVDSVTGTVGTPSGQTPVQTAFIASGGEASIYPAATYQGTSNGSSNFSFATPYTTYLDPGSVMQAYCARGPAASGIAQCNFLAAGHLESIN